jgi:hypothetical protein
VNDKRSATLSDKPNAQKKEASQHRIFGETGCNHINGQKFRFVKSPLLDRDALVSP